MDILKKFLNVFFPRAINLAFTGVLLSVFFSPGKPGLLAREVSVEESLKNLLEENIRLREENNRLKEETEKHNARVSMYQGRIRGLTARINELNEKLEAERARLNEEREKVEREIAKIEERMAEFQRVIEESKREREEDIYFIKWKEAAAEVEIAREKLLKISPENEELKARNGKLHYNLGNLFFEKGEYERAENEYEQALKLLPNDADIYYNLAIINDYYLKNSEKAQNYYTLYLQKEVNPANDLLVKERIAENKLRQRVRQ